MKKRAVFLDRDGVMIQDRDHLDAVERLRVLKATAPAMRLLREAGFKLVMVTNQSGVARGYFSMRTVAAIHAELKRRLKRQGATLDAIYVSPHGPDSPHPWRKPKPGMPRAAAKRPGLDLKSSYMIGDKTSDVECARRAGCAGILVRTGKGGRDRAYKTKPAKVAADILAAARWIVSRERNRAPVS